MTNVSRRGFLSTLSATGAVAAVSLTPSFSAQTETIQAQKAKAVQIFANGIPKAVLGKTGIETSLIGVGTGMSGGWPYYNMGEDKFVELMRHAFDHGVRYIDTAQNYRTHIYVQRALRDWNRDDFFLLTKTPSRSEETVRSDVGRYLYELNVKHLDTVLLHCMTNGHWPSELAGAWNALKEEKKQGRVRSIGVSCHSLDAIKAALEVDELDMILVRINPFGKEFLMDDTPEKVVPVVKELHEKGVGILGMKIFGEGRCKTPEQRRESLEYVTNLGCIDSMTIGFTEIPQVDETLKMLSEICAK